MVIAARLLHQNSVHEHCSQCLKTGGLKCQ